MLDRGSSLLQADVCALPLAELLLSGVRLPMGIRGLTVLERPSVST